MWLCHFPHTLVRTGRNIEKCSALVIEAHAGEASLFRLSLND
uniref:Uncharacterized protein n=1 Tax=Anguilla anguilla TaxID=7936 RepID=A0A0E9RUA0_ANGAN